MRLITRFELATKTDHELHGLYRELFNRLGQSKISGISKTNTLASMQNIKNELLHRNIGFY